MAKNVEEDNKIISQNTRESVMKNIKNKIEGYRYNPNPN